MIRTIIVPDASTINISLSIPDSYIGEEMEIIALSKKEGLEKVDLSEKKVSFNAVSIDTSGFTFKREEANER